MQCCPVSLVYTRNRLRGRRVPERSISVVGVVFETTSPPPPRPWTDFEAGLLDRGRGCRGFRQNVLAVYSYKSENPLCVRSRIFSYASHRSHHTIPQLSGQRDFLSLAVDLLVVQKHAAARTAPKLTRDSPPPLPLSPRCTITSPANYSQ